MLLILQNCRLYYSQIQMEPQHAAVTYNNANTNKKVIVRLSQIIIHQLQAQAVQVSIN